MTKREQVLEQSGINAVSKTISYDLIDMILLELDDLTIAAALHRYWICNKIKENLHETPFFDAIENNDPRIIKSLSNLHKSSLSDAIDYASKLGNLEIVKYLHSIGAEPSWEAINNASQCGYLEVVEYLYDITDRFKVYAISNASERGYLEMMKFLYHNDNGVYYGTHYNIDYNEDVEGIESFDNTTYIVAMKNNHLDIVKFLYDNEVAYDEDLFEWIVENGRLDILQFLHNIDAKTVMDYGLYIMSAASEYDQLEIIQFLHNVGIEYGDHTMGIACTYGNLEVVRYLYETGMKFDYEDCMCWAIENGHIDVIKFICETSDLEYTIDAVNLAFKHEQIEIARYLAKNLC
jgi:ankyrin repeat protein